ncbi:hypothetical protein ABD86_23505 [Paenibacillus alvei]|nr:hypothetical protein PAV_6c03000 [Paenibacillus alvei DSM 29]MBG9735537.1 hypothetical protein [Paenibacillus alvei]MBG9746732.1 hypothetical protein [Paenibacillus alvei]
MMIVNTEGASCQLPIGNESLRYNNRHSDAALESAYLVATKGVSSATIVLERDLSGTEDREQGARPLSAHFNDL